MTKSLLLLNCIQLIVLSITWGNYRLLNRMLLMIIALQIMVLSYAQGNQHTEYPEIGKKCPDFGVSNIEYFKKKNARLSDFKGKWLILDFWNKGCTGCISSFPKINEEFIKYKDAVQLILVGEEDAENKIRTIFYKFRDKLHLTFPYAFDSSLCRRFDIHAAPYILVIDPNGIVKGITFDLRDEDINAFLSGKTPKLQKAYRSNEKPLTSYSRDLPFLVYGNGGDDTSYLFRSLLSKWDVSVPVSRTANVKLANGRFESIGTNLPELYSYAYFGQDGIGFNDSLYLIYWGTPIFDVKEPTKIVPDYHSGTNIFSYSLSAPEERSQKEILMKIIQNDLENYFGYNVHSELRLMPCWKLVASNGAADILRTKGDESFASGDHTTWIAKNYPVSITLNRIASYFKSEKLFIDDTHIEGNIDIQLNCIWNDFDEVQKALIHNGLNLVKDEIEIKVIVVTDQGKR